MLRLFVTGDNHIGLSYDSHPKRGELVKERTESISRMVEEANRQECDFFVVTGDLFDSKSVGKASVKAVVDALKKFSAKVLVLPGNHDYYNSGSTVWKYFNEAIDGCSNITLLCDSREYAYDIREERAVFYPAICDSRNSDTNRLDWIKAKGIAADNEYRIGVAHGALDGLTYDAEGQYFPMKVSELESVPLDAWLIGHAHVCYPADVTTEYKNCGRIFNVGTHVQRDVHNNTEGYCFIVEIESGEGQKSVRVKKWNSSELRFARPDAIKLKAGDNLKAVLEDSLKNYSDKTVIDKLRIEGVVSDEDYADKTSIAEEVGKRFLEFDVDLRGLSKNITETLIDREYDDGSLPNQLLKKLMDDPIAVQMAYELLHGGKEA